MEFFMSRPCILNILQYGISTMEYKDYLLSKIKMAQYSIQAKALFKYWPDFHVYMVQINIAKCCTDIHGRQQNMSEYD